MKSSNYECTICLDIDTKSELITLHGTHIFHAKCLVSCEKQQCPICRRPFNLEDYGLK